MNESMAAKAARSEAAPWSYRAILFDLDGTLVDSAPDLAGAVNEMRLARGLEALPFAQLRPMVGAGARGMIGRAFGLTLDNDEFAVLRDEFLQRYEARMTQATRVFPAVLPLLAALDALACPWGIVTNKAARFAEPLIHALGLAERTAVLVCGDTTPHAKPHPEPLFEAARQLGLGASECVYVGDDLRDVRAGQAAGMKTVAVGWGYLGSGDAIEVWGADQVVATPSELMGFLRIV